MNASLEKVLSWTLICLLCAALYILGQLVVWMTIDAKHFVTEADAEDKCLSIPHEYGKAYFHCGGEIVCGSPSPKQICPAPAEKQP